ncbi:RNaseH domain-containing protein [Streptomyces sp. NPDC002851]
MATYNRLQPTTLVLRTDREEPLGAYHTFEFPQSLARDLRPIFNRSKDRNTSEGGEEAEGWNRLPLWALNHGTAALLPQALVTDGTGLPGRVWLAWNHQDGTPEPDKKLLVELVRSGLMVAATQRNDRARRRGRPEPIDLAGLAAVLQDLKATDLRSELRELRIRPDEPLQREHYQILPNLITTRLVSDNWHVEHAGWKQARDGGPREPHIYGVSHWRRVATAEGSEMVSWPPHVYSSSNNTEYLWSYTLKFTTQNHALDPAEDTLVHVRLGTRRWARNSVWDGKRAISTILFTPSPWANTTSPFARASMSWQPGPKGKKEGKMVWDDVLALTLARFTSKKFLPSAPELAANPQQFLQPDDGPPLAGVLFRDGLGDYCHHSVGTGASARDRWQVFRQLHPALKDIAVPEQPLRRLPVPVRDRPSATDLLRLDQEALVQVTGPRIAIDVLCDTTVMRDLLLEILYKAFGLPAPGPHPVHREAGPHERVLRCDGLDVVIRTQPVAELADTLSVDSAIKNRKDRARKAAAPRRALATARLHAPKLSDVPRFALIEMANANAYESSEHDPKESVKAAAASLGVLVQNITPPKSAGELPGAETAATRTQRASKAVMDLLARQTGLLAHPAKPGLKDSPLNEVTTVGLWVVRRNKEHGALLPLAVSHAPDEPFARIRMPHTGAWLPFHQGLLTLADFDIERRLQDEDVRGFFSRVVDEICDGSDVALLTLAQNLRTTCPGIANGPLKPDTLALDPKRPIALEDRKGLRHIRLRTNVRDETSQHFSYAGDSGSGDVGVGSHFWVHPTRPRHFFSTAKKPAAAGNGSPKGSRIEAHWGCTGKDENKNKQYGMKHDTLQDVWNPQLLELLVACHAPGDDPAAWAALIHQQRYEASHFSDPLALPTVLHLAHSVGKHILPDYLLEPITEPDD